MTERRRPGRPPIPDRLKRDEILHLRLPVEVYDCLARLALRDGLPVSVVARFILATEAPRRLNFRVSKTLTAQP